MQSLGGFELLGEDELGKRAELHLHFTNTVLENTVVKYCCKNTVVAELHLHFTSTVVEKESCPIVLLLKKTPLLFWVSDCTTTRLILPAIP